MRTAHKLARLTCAAAALVSATLFVPVAGAQSTFDVTLLAAACANCHGPEGRSPGSIPSIAGRPESVLLEQLHAFQSDNPPANTTIMDRLAKGFNDEELTALARHFSQIDTQQ